jgi:ATP-dependent 26S proteasome regulatory subunit
MSGLNPCGRLVVMDGPPGTGKSYAIRALAKAVDATFVAVAPSLVGSLSGPDLVPVLLQQKRQGRPVVLVMEDADHALAVRTRGDLHQLSELLNIGDGLLGDLVDLRIVATTNAERDDLDPAVVRPGRLCRRVSMGYLPPDLYEKVYKRLTGKRWRKLVPTKHTLADVYRVARDEGWRPAAKPPTGQYL